MLGFLVDALTVGAFIGVALVTSVIAAALTLFGTALAIAIPVAIGWFLWYSLAYILTLNTE